jgi:hypothetical protein
MVAAGNRWVWDAGFENWLKAGYFRHELARSAEWLWGIPLLVAVLVGLLFPLAQSGRGNLRWLFHSWFLAGIIFYAFGAEEFVQNPLEFAHHRFTELRSLLGYATPRLLADIEGTTELVDKDRDWSIYRILPPPR